MTGRPQILGANLNMLMGFFSNSQREQRMNMLTYVIGVKKKLVTATVAADAALIFICAAMASTMATKSTVILLSCARLKKVAPSMEKEVRARPARIEPMIGIAALLLWNSPPFTMSPMITQEGP